MYGMFGSVHLRQDIFNTTFAAIKNEISVYLYPYRQGREKERMKKKNYIISVAIKEIYRRTIQYLINFMFSDINFRLQLLKPSSQLSVFM